MKVSITAKDGSCVPFLQLQAACADRLIFRSKVQTLVHGIQLAKWRQKSYSDSSTAASTRSNTNPMAMPANTRPLMTGTMVKISLPTVQVVLDRAEQLVAKLANFCSVLALSPKAMTLFSAFNPPKRLSLLAPALADVLFAACGAAVAPALVTNEHDALAATAAISHSLSVAQQTPTISVTFSDIKSNPAHTTREQDRLPSYSLMIDICKQPFPTPRAMLELTTQFATVTRADYTR